MRVNWEFLHVSFQVALTEPIKSDAFGCFVRNEFPTPVGQRCSTCNPRSVLSREERKGHTPEHLRLVQPRWVPNVSLFQEVLFPLESSDFEALCCLQFLMAKLRNQAVRRKVLVLSYNNLRHIMEGYGVACFLMKVEPETRNTCVPDGHSTGLFWLS
uniref:Uncharacterized protein n=1 Tax=Molossus molossus TaxID=27622 RepID=A0A7J8ESH1_MOLMO|nr:hypothetical protein HJG59_008692 [Molossus molossus]